MPPTWLELQKEGREQRSPVDIWQYFDRMNVQTSVVQGIVRENDCRGTVLSLECPSSARYQLVPESPSPPPGMLGH